MTRVRRKIKNSIYQMRCRLQSESWFEEILYFLNQLANNTSRRIELFVTRYRQTVPGDRIDNSGILTDIHVPGTRNRIKAIADCMHAAWKDERRSRHNSVKYDGARLCWRLHIQYSVTILKTIR